MIVGHGWQSKVECFPTDVSDAITSVMCQQANMKNIFISGPGSGEGGGGGGRAPQDFWWEHVAPFSKHRHYF